MKTLKIIALILAAALSLAAAALMSGCKTAGSGTTTGTVVDTNAVQIAAGILQIAATGGTIAALAYDPGSRIILEGIAAGLDLYAANPTSATNMITITDIITTEIGTNAALLAIAPLITAAVELFENNVLKGLSGTDFGYVSQTEAFAVANGITAGLGGVVSIVSPGGSSKVRVLPKFTPAK